MERAANTAAAMERSKISVITPSLNQGRFLRENIESILNQSYRNVEHVIVDGRSTDNTLDILKEYPHLKWISEKEGGDLPVLDAIWKAFHISTGDYIVFSCVSDGIVDKNWFGNAAAILDNDIEVSHVWGIPENRSEDGQLLKICHPEFIERHPPQKKDFLPFWLATGEGVEQNAVYRRRIFEAHYTKNSPDEPLRHLGSLGFNYNLNTHGHLPWFLPVITNFGRVHRQQLQEKHEDLYAPVSGMYFRSVERYGKNLLSGKIRHYFRDGESRVIGEATPADLGAYRKAILRYRLGNSLRRKFQRILDRI